MTKVLVKANDDVISFCECEVAFASTGQLDCPWCGCGWLFTCTQCHRAFTFASIAETEYSHRDIAARSFAERHKRVPTAADEETIASEADLLRHWAEQNEQADGLLVLLDGKVLPMSARGIAFDGWHARHELDSLPHLHANAREELEHLFGPVRYWTERKIDGRV